MKIALALFMHETNGFSPLITSYEDFEVVEGDAMLERVSVTPYFNNIGAEVVPIMFANNLPSGKIDKESFYRFREELVGGIPTDVDGVWLHLHGAMEVEHIGSGEAALTSAIREKVGDKVLISVALDFHANNTTELCNNVNIITGYRTVPHTDADDTELRAAELLVRCLEENIYPEPHMIAIPFIANGDIITTEVGPGKTIMDSLWEIDKDEEILSISFFGGQPWVDAPNSHASVVVVPNKNKKRAIEKAKELAALFWNVKDNFQFKSPVIDPEEAVKQALSSERIPVFISDSGDNTTGGAPGDNAFMLKILLDYKVKNALVAGIYDSIAIDLCKNSKIGETIQLTIGAGISGDDATSVDVEATIRHIGELKNLYGLDAGLSATLRYEGIDFIVTENRCAFVYKSQFEKANVNIHDYQIIVVKLGYLFPELQEIAGSSIIAFTLGACCENITLLNYTQLKSPIYPFNNDMVWNP